MINIKGIVLIYAIYTIYAFYSRYKFKQIELLKYKKVGVSDNIYFLYNHGLKTLKNGMNNIISYICSYWLMIFCISLFDYLGETRLVYFYKVFWYFWSYCIICSLSSDSYKLSEIKHLEDGISETVESDLFFIKYSLLGFIGIITNLIIIVLFDYTLIESTVMIVIWIIIFIMGMGDLLQVRGINEFGGKSKNFKEGFYMWIDIPKNILRVIFYQNYRNEFIIELKRNLVNIYRGIKRVLHEYTPVYKKNNNEL